MKTKKIGAGVSLLVALAVVGLAPTAAADGIVDCADEEILLTPPIVGEGESVDQCAEALARDCGFDENNPGILADLEFYTCVIG